MIALVSLRLEPPWQAKLESLLEAQGFTVVTPPPGSAAWREAIRTSDVAFLSGTANPDFLGAGRLRWIHCGQAGLDAYLPSELLATGVSITCASGRSGPSLAEQALSMMLALAHDHEGVSRLRRWRAWEAPSPTRRRALGGRTVAVIGVGNTGSRIARYCSALDMRVLGWRRSAKPHPEGVTEGFSAANGDSLVQVLSRAEFVAIACGLNNASYRLLGERELAALPRGAFLVNVARGLVVDEAAMLAALRSGQLGGAGLDVFTREPLPIFHPLWRMRNVISSPHAPPRLDARERRHYEQIETNLGRFQRGEPLHQAMTALDAYDRPPLHSYHRTVAERVTARVLRAGRGVFGPRAQ